MAELAPRERLQPSLLDRLTDDDVDAQIEGRDKRVLSMRGLRRAVLRDLGWLFNASGLHTLQTLEAYPLASSSVLNYGFRDLTGKTISGIDIAHLEDALRTAILNFEPRILAESLAVRAVSLASSKARPNQISFELIGELWGQPLPERFYLKTDIDMDIGEVTIVDADARSS